MKKFYEAGVCHHTIEGLSWTLTELTNQQKTRKGKATLIKRKGDFHCLGGLWIRTLKVLCVSLCYAQQRP